MGILIIFDSAPESIKKSISRSGARNSLFLGLSERNGIVQIFSLFFLLVVLFVYFDKYVL